MIVNKMPTAINNKILPGFTYTGNYQVVDDGDEGWRIKFLSSGTLKLKRRATVDVFLVGGGGSGSVKAAYSDDECGGGGGGGGETYTSRGENLSSNTNYQIVIGSGGAAVGKYTSGNGFKGNDGGTTYLSFPGSASLWAEGGRGGYHNNGGYGGSGGGNGGWYGASGSGSYKNRRGWYGGSNGSNGGAYSEDAAKGDIGYGSGGTTREFWENNGTLYSGGGGGGSGQGTFLEDYGAGGAGGGGRGAAHSSNAANGGANTGGGGGGGHYGGSATSAYNRPSGAGGSGIVIIRNHRE